MTKRKSTIRRMTGLSTTREFYHLVSDLSLITKRLDKLADRIAAAERAETALLGRRKSNQQGC